MLLCASGIEMPDAQSNRAGDQEIHRQLDNLGRSKCSMCFTPSELMAQPWCTIAVGGHDS